MTDVKHSGFKFGPDRCHHRDANGKPNCTKTRWLRASGTGYRGNLCETHERTWREAAKSRAAAKTPASPAAAKPAKSKTTTTTTRPTTKRPPRGKVVPLTADEGPLDPLEASAT